MKNRFFLSLISLALLAAGSQGCATTLQTPPGFAELDSHDYAYRATSPQGVVVAARSEKNELHTGTDFWAESIDLQLQRGGYRKDGAARDVTSAKGLKGKELRYAVTREGREHRYWIAVFAKSRTVLVVEAGGDAEPFDRSEAAVEKALLSVD